MQDSSKKFEKKKIVENSEKNGKEEKRKNRASTPSDISVSYEELGFFPGSFRRVFDRFIKQLFYDVENLAVKEYRIYRYLFLTSIKCILTLLFVPFLFSFIAKQTLIHPLTEYLWNTKQPEIFLSAYQQKIAFSELEDFEEMLYFQSLLPPEESCPALDNFLNKKTLDKNSRQKAEPIVSVIKIPGFLPTTILKNNDSLGNHLPDNLSKASQSSTKQKVEKCLQQKTIELAIRYNNQSIEAITNFFTDLLGFLALWFLFFVLKLEVKITKVFLIEVFFGIDDTKKSLVILFITDFFVGYHSSNLWESFFRFLFNHYGVPENQTTIFFLVGTIPVLVDVMLKYFIFRHLNRASPSTVATYHALIE
ncbi:unnamed protein product [Sphagnum balticum]